MKHSCDKYGVALVAQLEGTLPAAVAAELKAHLRGCGACQAELAAMKETAEVLEALGETLTARIPVVDVLAGVLAGAESLRAGRRSLEPLFDEREDVIAYLDGELDDFSAARIERERGKDAMLDAELAALAKLQSDLEGLGASVEVPRVDLVASVVALAKDRAVDAGALPEALNGLPEAIRLSAERFIEGEASADEVAQLQEFAVGVPALAALLDDYTTLHAELDALAVDEARSVPRIDIVSDVVAAVRRLSRGENVTPFRRPASAQPVPAGAQKRGWWAVALTAAAACLLVGIYLGQNFLGSASAVDPMAEKKKSQPFERVSPDDSVREDTKNLVNGNEQDAGEGATDANPIEGMDPGQEVDPNGTEPTELAQATGKGARTLKDVLDVRQKAMEDDQVALAKLMRWSTLSEQEARKVLADKNADPAAIIGAAEFLPPGEAAPLLKAAVDRNPDDPYLRKALAKAYADSGDTEMARQALDDWSRIDPENSVPKYLAAKLAFQGGDVAGGLLAMESAAGYEHGSVYSTQAANYRRSALGATGYTGDVSTFLAGSTAGTSDYQYTMNLANELMDQGNQLQQSGNYADAQKVYLGVYNLGAQLSNSASLANDYAGAYDIQSAALDALARLAEIFGGVDSGTVTQLVNELQNGMAALTQLMNAYNQIFGSGNLQQILDFLNSTLGGAQLGALQ